MDIQPHDWLYLGVIVVLLLLSGLFSAAEIGILSLNRFRLHQQAEEGSSRARLVQRLLQQPSRTLTVILIIITALNYTNESITTYWLHGVHALPEWVPFVGLLVMVLIFAEVTPVSYAAANPEIVATRMAPILAAATAIMRPVVVAMSFIANLALRLVGGQPRQRPLVTGEEVRTIVDIETERGILEEEEKELIHSIFEFSDTIVREIMIPRIDVIAVSDDTSLAETIDLTNTYHFSRVPVFHTSIDHIVGLVHAKDLLPYLLQHRTDLPVREAMHPAYFVPETKLISELLQEFRETKQTLAIVLDEYGGTSGLVTVEDLLEEIVGEIYDEYDVQQPSVEWLDTRTVIVDGKTPIDEASELINHELPEGEYDTVGGLLYSRFGDVPSPGEQIIIDGYQLIVERLDGHRIAKVRIISPPPTEL